MATDDPATVLEQFIHDVANLPAEIAHHLEEIQAKDQAMIQFRHDISSRDATVQRHVKNNGGHQKIPQEDKHIATVKSNYDKAIQLQEEKCILANKVARLLDRHVKRYDLQIRDLVSAGVFLSDPSLPTVLEESTANLAPLASTSGTGANTPLGAHIGVGAGGAHSSTSIADLARSRNLPPTILATNRSNSSAQPMAGAQAGINGASGAPRQTRESSIGAGDAKRRRLQNATLNIAAQPSGLRQSSQGPAASTPKATTPGATSRAGSAGPARTKKAPKKTVPSNMRKVLAAKGGGLTKKQRRLAQGKKGTPSTTESSPSDEEFSEAESAASQRRKNGGQGGQGDEDAEDADGGNGGYEEDGDDTRYCICAQPSHGDMVACDNENCELEWFHWGCVGLTAPPKGRWLCPRCKDLPKAQLKLAR